MITISELKKISNNCNVFIANNISLNDDYTLTENDILSGKFVKVWKENKDIRKCINGFTVNENNEVEYKYVSLSYVELNERNYYVSCCEQDLVIGAIGVFKISVNNINGEIKEIKTIKSKINVLFDTSNNEWVENGENKNTLHISNNDGETRKCVLNAIHHFNGMNIKTPFTVKQNENKITDWLFDKDEILDLTVSLSPSFLPKEGGTSVITVKKFYKKHYHKENGCGVIVDKMVSEELISDVTRTARYSLSNAKDFKRTINTINAKEQELFADERKTTITVTYGGVEKSVILTQEKGAQRVENIIFTFKDDSFNQKITAMPSGGVIEIPITYLKNISIDGDLISSEQCGDIYVSTKEEWVDYEVSEDGRLYLMVKPNENESLIRESIVTIINGYGKKLMLEITQTNDTLIKTTYHMDMDCSDMVFTSKEIEKAIVLIKTHVVNLYASGRKVDCITTLPKNIKLNVSAYSNNIECIKLGKCRDIGNGDLIYKPNVVNTDSFVDSSLLTTFEVVDENGVTQCTKKKIFTLKGKEKETYKYSFNYSDGTKFKALNLGCGDVIKLKVDSFKHGFVNGIETSKTPVKFKFFSLSKDYYFNVVCDEKTLIISLPNKPLKNNIKEKYAIYQEESTLQIVLEVSTNITEKTKNVDFIVSLETSDNLNDAWTNDNAILKITNSSDNEVKTLPLTKAWVSPKNNINSDVLFSGKVDFVVGREYKFKSEKLEILKNGYEKITNNHVIDETYVVDDDDEKIEIIINP